MTTRTCDDCGGVLEKNYIHAPGECIRVLRARIDLLNERRESMAVDNADIDRRVIVLESLVPSSAVTSAALNIMRVWLADHDINFVGEPSLATVVTAMIATASEALGDLFMVGQQLSQTTTSASEARALLAMCEIEKRDLAEVVKHAERERNEAYFDRDLLLRLVGLVGISQYVKMYTGIDHAAPEGFRTVVFCDLPSGQISYHVSDAAALMFEQFPIVQPKHPDRMPDQFWDGHTTHEKRRRVFDALKPLQKGSTDGNP